MDTALALSSAVDTSRHAALIERWKCDVAESCLDTCLCCQEEAELVQAVRELDVKNIKGLGPACANLLYFLHPLGVPDHEGAAFFLVALDAREQDVRAQCARPAFSRVSTRDVRYLGYSQLRQHKESIARFGSGLKGMVAISACLSL